MRITGGSARGQTIKAMPGLLVRPTTDRVREAVFSMLASLSADWERCLDLFVGTGALGIEALSRGAQWVDFVDQSSKSCGIIRQNLQSLGFNDKAHVYCCPVMKTLTVLSGKFGVVFLDPPYADTSLGDVLVALDRSSLLKDDSLVVTSHSSRFNLGDRHGTLLAAKMKRYGDSSISIFHKEDAP